MILIVKISCDLKMKKVLLFTDFCTCLLKEQILNKFLNFVGIQKNVSFQFRRMIKRLNGYFIKNGRMLRKL